MPNLIKLSPSALNLMEDCERCFYLDRIKGIKRPDAPFPSLPSGMDKILKEHFDRFMEKGKLPPEIRELDCKLFEDKEKLKLWRNNLKGIQYLYNGILLRGAVDNILTKGNKLIVLDYKTRGYPLKEDTHEHYQTQMDIYSFLLKKNNYETEDYAYLLFYYPNKVNETGEVIFNTNLVKIKTNLKNAEKLLKKASEILKGKIPKKSKTCQFCMWNS